MFIYISPTTGGTAFVDSIERGKKATGGFKVNWQGGGAWEAPEHRLTGNIKKYEDLEDMPQTEFDAGLERILASAPSEEAIASASVTEEED